MRAQSVLLAAAVTAAAAAAMGDDWPRWRGPDGTGISRETEINPGALAAEPKIAWRAAVGKGYSSMTVAAKRLYAMGSASGKDTVFCFDADSGEPVWRYDYACGKGEPRSTPVVDDGCVYTMSQEGLALCLDAATGAVKWQCDIVKEYGAALPKWGHSGSALIADNAVIYNAGVHGLALDKKTGQKIWTGEPGVGGYATPVPYDAGGAPALLLFGEKGLHGVSLAEGKRLWSFPWKTSYDVNAPDPLLFDGKAFITSGYGRGCALLDVLDVASGEPKKLWENQLIASHFGSCVLLDGHIYGISGNGGKKDAALRCLEALTGKEAWGQTVGFGSLIAAGDRLIALLDGGTLLIAAADPSGYKELTRATVLSQQCWTAPILSGGRVYARNTPGDLVCVNLR
ncbi:MAG: alcohol dehydrogenase [Lentisphaerae bacterium]|nr:alcohol dehydrogenase [Lentisphaerota bacterium]